MSYPLKEPGSEDKVQIEDLALSTTSRSARKLEKRVKRKIDLFILPLIAITYFLAQMVCQKLHLPVMANKLIIEKGQSDLGNANVAGMSQDLHFTSKEYSNIASIFLVGYLLFQIPV